AKRFDSYGWHVERVVDGNDLGALDTALAAARRTTDRPSLVIVRTHIAYGSPHKQDTPEAHGAPLGEEEVKLTQQLRSWPRLEPFAVPAEALAHWRRARERGARLEAEWREAYEVYRRAFPELAAEFERRLAGRLPEGWDAELPAFTTGDAQATRAAAGKTLNAIAAKLPELIGGSADLAGSTQLVFKTGGGGGGAAGRWGARNVQCGMRAHGLRAVPNLVVIRPADPAETVEAWRAAILRREGPVALVLTRQKVAALDRTKYAPANGLRLGGYVLADAPGGKPSLVLIATGSEVELALGAYERLAAERIAARVVSMPSMELFARQPPEYRDAVLPPAVTARLAIEAASPQPWYRWVGETGAVLGIERFGASAPYQRIYQEFGLTVDNVVRRAKELLRT